jgi:hypothetical protein
LADLQGCPHEGKVVDMKGVDPEVSRIPFDVGCPVRVYEGQMKSKRVQTSADRSQLIRFPGDATDQKTLDLLFRTFLCLP